MKTDLSDQNCPKIINSFKFNQHIFTLFSVLSYYECAKYTNYIIVNINYCFSVYPLIPIYVKAKKNCTFNYKIRIFEP